jgi:hypothetical protein
MQVIKLLVRSFRRLQLSIGSVDLRDHLPLTACTQDIRTMSKPNQPRKVVPGMFDLSIESNLFFKNIRTIRVQIDQKVLFGSIVVHDPLFLPTPVAIFFGRAFVVFFLTFG